MSETAQRPGHIPGAASIPWAQTVKEDGTFKDADDLRTLYESKGITPDKDVIAYCRIGERSSHSWFVLHELLGLRAGPQLRRLVDRVRQPHRRADREAGGGRSGVARRLTRTGSGGRGETRAAVPCPKLEEARIRQDPFRVEEAGVRGTERVPARIRAPRSSSTGVTGCGPGMGAISRPPAAAARSIARAARTGSASGANDA